MINLPRLERALFWIFIHSCSIWFFSIFLAGLASSGLGINNITYVFVMGLGITSVAKMIRLKTRRIRFNVNTDFFVWVCISTFSFWISQILLASLFYIKTGLSYFLFMGCGIYILSLIFSNILASKKYYFLRKSPFKVYPKMHVKYGKYIKIETEIFNYVNEERKKQNVHSLAWSDSLYSDAQRRAKEITIEFAHKNIPKGCGENIGKIPLGRVLELGFVGRKNIARSFVKMWMESPGHRENILRSNYSSICLGITKLGKYYYGVQLFT
jgi:hypothetical protein